MSNKKSGQAALILVIVTMVTVLGIGIASSTQSTISLRDSVYSTQSEQALACAEAGAEYSIGVITSKDYYGVGSYDPEEPNSDGKGIGYLPCESGSCVLSTPPLKYDCSFEYDINSYPGADNVVEFSKINENTVQELNFKSSNSNTNLGINVNIVGGNSEKAALAVYSYRDTDTGYQVQRDFYYFGTGSVPTGYKSSSSTITIPSKTVAIRIRPIYADLSVKFTNYPTDVSVAYSVTSIGRAGPVRRQMEAFRYLNQLPASFDEAVVTFDE